MSEHLKRLEAKVSENWKEVWADICLFKNNIVSNKAVIDSLAGFEAAVREHQTALLKEGKTND